MPAPNFPVRLRVIVLSTFASIGAGQQRSNILRLNSCFKELHSGWRNKSRVFNTLKGRIKLTSLKRRLSHINFGNPVSNYSYVERTNLTSR